MAWYNVDWDYRVKITINAAEVDATLTDFPVYVNLANLPAGFHTNVNQTDARDIRVTTSDETTEVPREVVFYTSASDTGELHFKAPSLSHTTDTDFYIYYGNAGATEPARTATYGSDNVWKTAYLSVHHLEGGVGDSTSNNRTTTNNGSTSTTGQLGAARSFDGTNDSLTMPFDGTVTDKVTVSGWIEYSNATATQLLYELGPNFNSSTPAFATYIDSGNIDVSIRGNAGYNIARYAAPSINTLRHFTFIHDMSAAAAEETKMYVNGVHPSRTKPHNSNNTSTGYRNDTLNIFSRNNANFFAGGKLDELRIYNGVQTQDWIDAEYSNQATPATFYTAGAQEVQSTTLVVNDMLSSSTVDNIDLVLPGVEGWYNVDWDYRVKITVNAAEVDATLTDFPVYVNLANLPAGFHTNVKSDGSDIRITTANGETEVAREVVSYDSAGDTGELHFKAPSLSHTTDTDFYIYYGNASATEPARTATYGSDNVWSAYSGVWHMGDASSTTISDSTSNSYTGTKLSSGNPVEATGIMGDAQTFSDDYVGMGNVLNIGLNDVAISQWIKTTSTITANVHTLSKAIATSASYRYSVRISSTGKAGFFIKGNSGSDVIHVGSTSIDNSQWRHITVLFDRSGNASLYVDGVFDSSVDISMWSAQDFQTTHPFRIGSYTASNGTGIFGPFPGSIDETKIRMSLISADWIAAEYSNQNTPATFYTAGAQEEQSGTPPTVALNSPADASSGSDTTPTLEFTGTDAQGDDIRYNVQVDTVNTFDGVIDSYSESNQDSTLPTGSTFGESGQTFTGDGKTLYNVQFYMSKTNSPTGSVTARVYAISGTHGTNAIPTGTALATSDSFDLSTLTTSLAITTFTFSGANRITLANGTNYAVVVVTGATGGTDIITWGTDNSSPTHGGNGFRYADDTGLYTESSHDVCFYVNSGVILDKVSGTDAGFANTVTPADTDPFTSGEMADYDVQAGDALSAGTYYWRVRGLDPTGSNTYGAWSSTRSFEVTSGTDLIVPDSLYSVTLDNVALTQQNTLALADSLSSSTLDNVALTQAHTLVVNDMLSSVTLDNTVLTTDTPLVVADMTSSSTVDNVALTQANTLAVQDSLSSVTLDNTVLTQANTLVVADSLSSVTLDNTIPTTNTPLVVADSLSSSTVDNVALTQAHTLVVADSLSSTTVDNTVLTQANTLVVADSLYSTTLDNTELSQATTLTVADSLSSATLDAVTSTQQNTLALADSLFSATVDNVALTQANTLVVADSLSSTTVDNVELTQAIALVVADSLSSVTLDAVSLTQANTLVVSDSLSSTTIDNVALTQAHTLVVQDMTSSTTVDNTSLTQAHNLVVADSLSDTTVSNIVLDTELILFVNNMLSSSTVDNVALTQANTLTLADMLSSVSVDNVSLLLQVDARKYYIDSDANVYWVVNQALGLVEKI